MRKFRALMIFGILAFAPERASAECTDYLCDSLFPCWTFCTYPYTADVNLSYNYFRGLPNVCAQRNSGGLASINLGAPFLGEWNPFGAQLGGSYAMYDFSGRRIKDKPKEKKDTERQVFATAALTLKTPYYCGINLGLAYDLMYAKNFTQFEVEPLITQVRYQAGYLFERKNELGFWGTVYANCAHKRTSDKRIGVHAVDQFNVFWSHYFAPCTKFSVWVGVPTTGSANKFIAGGYIRLPINDCFSIEGNVGYMTRNRHRGEKEYVELDKEGKVKLDKEGEPVVHHPKGHSYLNACFGLTYFFGCTHEYHGHKRDYSPYMSIGNNSNFILQTHVREKKK